MLICVCILRQSFDFVMIIQLSFLEVIHNLWSKLYKQTAHAQI